MDRLQRLKKINNYGLYYARDYLDELSEFDLVIVEPLAHNNKSIEFLNKRNTLVIGYVSILEIDSSSETLSLLEEEDYLTINSARQMNTAYNNYIMDLRSERWKLLLINKMGNLIENEHYDGIFLDTIADIEHFDFESGLREVLIAEYVKLLKELRKYFPKHIFIQNNGAGQIIDSSAKLINGLMLENQDISQKNTELNLKLTGLKEKNGIEIFILSEEGKRGKGGNFNRLVETSKENDFLLYVAPHKYIGKVNSPINTR
jgi:endo-alpha-1,4-polygalactosaminidase (GH114 family)